MGSSGDAGLERDSVVETPADVEVSAEYPMSLTSFVGRDQELTELRSLFREGARLVTLTGIGGIGKTRLALKLGISTTELGLANVYFVELANVTNPGLIDNVVLESVGGGSSRSPLQAAVDYLRESRALLVLDCCEHVVETVGHVAEVLFRGCRSLAILATSRAPLDIPGELVWSVPALSMLAGGASGGRGASEGARLFADRAEHVDAHFELNEEVLGSVETIVRRVDGIPLAIELAAARVRVLSPREIAESLNDHLRLLRSARRLDSRHQTIRDSLDWSFALLTSEERQLFARLAIFSGGFDMDAATAVCGGSPINPDQMLDKVQGLLDKSLLVVESKGGATRFGMLDFVRQYASERLVTSGEEPQVALRLRVYFRALAERADRELWGLDAAGRARLDEESPNLRAAIDDGCRRAPEDAIAIVAALGLYWRLRGRLTEGVAATERSLATAPPEPSRGHALALANLSRLSFWLGDFSRTQSAAAAALEMSAAVGDIRSQAVALTPLGSLIIMGDPTRGDAILIEATESARTAGDDVALCDALAALAISYFFQDDSDAMRTALAESLHVAEAIGHEDAIRWCLWCSAHNALAAGELARARGRGCAGTGHDARRGPAVPLLRGGDSVHRRCLDRGLGRCPRSSTGRSGTVDTGRATPRHRGSHACLRYGRTGWR